MSNTITLAANSQASLVNAIDSVDAAGTVSASPTTYVLNITPGATIGLNSDLPAINLAAGDTLLVNGGGATLLGDYNERGLFVYSGTVEIANLTISNTEAIGGNGGNGWEGGGGGAGLGGGLFVGATAAVGLSNVNFVANAAIGGNGGRANGNGYYGLGGGGGMGGNGGNSGRFGTYGSSNGNGGNGSASGGGGGGIGRGANGYSSGVPAGSGIVHGLSSYNAGRYYAASGGGGGGFNSGGGIAPRGRTGGFGGGGGPYGSGGFGGGAGAFAKTGGWGGGGSGGAFPGQAGFGGGGGQNGGYQSISTGYGYYGGYYTRIPGKANGGGGLGAGGNVFVQQGGQLAIAGGVLLGGTVVGGQPGGGNAGPGGALGSAAFLQGYGILYLEPPAGQTLTVDGSIADQAGAGYGSTVQGSGTIAVAGAGRVVLTVASSYTGGTAINAGTLQLDNTKAVGSGPIVFSAGADATLDIAVAAAPANVIYGFGYGDAIHLATGPASVSYSQAQDTLSYGGTVLHFDPASAPAAIAYDAASGTVTVPCFAAGTRIATERGEVPVERLTVGDHVRLAGGGTAPIVWLGHRRIDCRRHARPQDVRPVRVAAHAFGLDRPRCDLLLSPDHAVFVDGVLIPVRYLINGATVAQEQAASVSYWHVELDRHGVLLAEGLPAESYLDTGNRTAFAGGKAVMAHPDFSRSVWAQQGCAPLVLSGPERDAVHRRLLAQAFALGHALHEEPALSVSADAAGLAGFSDGEGGMLFALPEGARRLRLRSRNFIPAAIDTASDDWRRLGVAVKLRLNGERPKEAAFRTGWHAPEEGGAWRWTDGDATLALGGLPGPGWLRLRLMAAGARYWAAPSARLRGRRRAGAG